MGAPKQIVDRRYQLSGVTFPAFGYREMLTNTTLHSNPFYILGVSTRDDRRKIVEIAEERSLHLSHELCQKARADLTNPRARLSAEISWMPGVAPAVVEKLANSLEHPVPSERGLPPLAQANLAAASFEVRGEGDSPESISRLVCDFAAIVESIDPSDVLRDINEDRAVAGFPEVSGFEAIEAELAQRRKVYRSVLLNLLDEMDARKMVEAMTDIVATATRFGAVHAPTLIDDLADAYEIKTQGVLEKERENLTALIGTVKASAASGEAPLVAAFNRLEAVARNWNKIAKPIQMISKSRGVDHRTSRDVAYDMRSLGIELNNEHSLLDHADRMTKLLQDLFSDLPEVVERLDEDTATIDDLRKQGEKRQRDNAQWTRDITFRADVGLLFKAELAISPEGIKWQNRLVPLDAVTDVRWGAVRHSVNGIPTGTSYTIAFADKEQVTVVELKKEATYEGFLSPFWRAVCVPLMFALLQRLKEGHQVVFGDMVVENEAVTLIRRRFFGSDEKLRLGWHDVHIWNAAGSFYIGSKNDKKFSGSATYKDHWNTHLLEHVVRGGFKKGVRKLSDYLEA